MPEATLVEESVVYDAHLIYDNDSTCGTVASESGGKRLHKSWIYWVLFLMIASGAVAMGAYFGTRGNGKDTSSSSGQ